MKTIKLFLLVAATVTLAFGCQQIEPIDELTMTSTKIVVPAEGTTQAIEFSASTDWTITSDQTWITFDVASGVAGDTLVNMTVEENLTYDNRTANVSIVAGDKTTKIEVVQNMLTSFDSEISYTINASEQTIEFSMEANVEYTFTISEDADWISDTPVSRSAPIQTTKTFYISANSSLAPRTGKIAVKAGDAVFGLVIVQNAEFENLSSASAACYGRTMKIYNGSKYFNFNEYAITLTDDNNPVKVVLAINQPDSTSEIAVLPLGTYLVDATGEHSANTFSIKSLDNSEPIYTTIINEDESEIVIEDGEITISKDNNTYTISAILIDNHENIHRYSYIGEIASVEDKSFGGYISDITFKGIYNTYFTTKANEWYFVVQASKAPTSTAMNVNYISFNIFGATGENYDGTQIPVGTFTFNEQTTSESVTFINGNKMSNTNDLTSLWAYTDNGDKGWQAKAGSTVTISKNDDNTYNLVYNLQLQNTEYIYDDNWNLLDTKVTDDTYSATIENVRLNCEVDVTSTTKPTPNADIEIKSAISSATGLYIGDKAIFDALTTPTFTIPTGTSLLVVGYTTLNGQHTLYMPLIVSGYTFTTNYVNRYCSTPPPAATYTFSKTPAENVLLDVLYGANSYCYFTNGYTGTKMPLTGGKVTLTASTITFALTMSDGTNTHNITGSIPFAYQFAQNWTTRAQSFKLNP